MEVKVLPPVSVSVVSAMDFNFDSACSTPYISAPSSPQRFGNYFYSAPTSPTTSHADFLSSSSSYSTTTIPFHWEEKPGIPRINASQNLNFDEEEVDFAFDFSGQLERTSVSADELFHKGKIKPLTLKPPPRLQSINGGFGDSETEFKDSSNFKSAISSPRTPISHGTKKIKEAFSPRRRTPLMDLDPFEEALKEARQETESNTQTQRGRQINSGVPSNSKPPLSLRVSDILYARDQDKITLPSTPPSPSSPSPKNASSSSTTNSFFSSFSFSGAYRKLKLKDFLLFRSASEGRATSKATMNKYEVFSKKSEGKKQSMDSLNKHVMSSSSIQTYENLKSYSFRSTDSVGSGAGDGSVSKRRGAPPLSAHELHYTVNRAVSEEMKRKTFLPYKQGLLGCLGFNPAAHDLSRGGGSMTRV